MLSAFPADARDESGTAKEPGRAWRNVSLTCLPPPPTSSTGIATVFAS
jgi:hypothetical protein